MKRWGPTLRSESVVGRNCEIPPGCRAALALNLTQMGPEEVICAVRCAWQKTTLRCDAFSLLFRSCPENRLRYSGSIFHPQPPSLLILLPEPGWERKVLTKETWFLFTKGVKVLETAVGAVFAPTRFSLVRISVRDLVADGKSLVRNSGVGGGGENLILRCSPRCKHHCDAAMWWTWPTEPLKCSNPHKSL